MLTQNRLLLYEQSGLGPHCLPERLLKHFSRRDKQTTFVVIDTLRVKQQSQSFWMKNFVIAFMIFSKFKRLDTTCELSTSM